MNKGFTLLELLVVVGIMGLLGTTAVGGYRQMQRGMEERGAKDNATQFISMVKQRASIDRMPTAVYCWNEMIREETEDENAVIVGKAVAIRCSGRVSHVSGQKIYDEFGNLEQFDDAGKYMQYDDTEPKITLYRFDPTKSGADAVTAFSAQPCTDESRDDFVSFDPRLDPDDNSELKGKFLRFGYKVEGSGTWRVGDFYGEEFQRFQLPHGYVFGSGGDLPSSMSTPITKVDTLVFDAFGNGQMTIDLSSIRPGSGGTLSAQPIGKTDNLNVTEM